MNTRSIKNWRLINRNWIGLFSGILSFNLSLYPLKAETKAESKPATRIEHKSEHKSESKADSKSEKKTSITAEILLQNYDKIMGPTNFSAEMRMTSYREDGSNRSYIMRALKSGDDKFRISFYEPSAVAGQEILRIGDNTWIYLPNLKRSSRLANRESFQGGDFNNSDVLRVNYQKDYAAELVESEEPNSHKIELQSKNKETSYDKIHLWFSKNNQMPLRGLYFGTSGKLLRSAEFKLVKDFGRGYQRPAIVVMKNEVIPARYSELEIRIIDISIEIPPQKFIQTDLGRP